MVTLTAKGTVVKINMITKIKIAIIRTEKKTTTTTIIPTTQSLK